MKPNKTYIVIATYNAMPWIDKCLKSTEPYPVVVIDNASQDETVAYIKEQFPDVVLLPQQENLGFGKANNIGISHALKQGAEQVFLLNQDAYLVDNCLKRLVELQQKYPEYGILSPIHITGDKKRLDKNFASLYVAYRKTPDFYSDFVLGNPLKPIYDVPFVNAAGWLLSKQCLLDVGGFDPMFYHYGEDDNYCQRTLYHGFKIGVVPNVFLIHDREDRKRSKIQPYSKAYYTLRERIYMVELGNINHNLVDVRVKTKKNKLRNEMIKALLQFNFNRFKGLKKEDSLLKSINPAILKSRKTNKTKYHHYLSV